MWALTPWGRKPGQLRTLTQDVDELLEPFKCAKGASAGLNTTYQHPGFTTRANQFMLGLETNPFLHKVHSFRLNLLTSVCRIRHCWVVHLCLSTGKRSRMLLQPRDVALFTMFSQRIKDFTGSFKSHVTQLHHSQLPSSSAITGLYHKHKYWERVGLLSCPLMISDETALRWLCLCGECWRPTKRNLYPLLDAPLELPPSAEYKVQMNSTLTSITADLSLCS